MSVQMRNSKTIAPIDLIFYTRSIISMVMMKTCVMTSLYMCIIARDGLSSMIALSYIE